MAKASALTLDQTNQSILMKGPYGFGKTLAGASFAVDGPVFISYWDKKKPVELLTYFTRERFGDKAEKILNNIEYEVYGADNANEYLNKLIAFTRDCRYTAIINDSLTFMTSATVNWSLNFGKDKNQLKTKIKDVLPDFDEYKVETSFVTQALDLSKQLPCHVIWTAHPVPRVNIEGVGSSIRVTKTNSIVSYGSKVAGIVPGAFTEIYHLFQQSDWNQQTGKASKKYMVSLDSIGDEFAKSPLLGDYIKEFDITDKLFYEVWKELLIKRMADLRHKPETEEKTLTEAAATATSHIPWKPTW
jgi:hypothetical protein